MPLIKFFNTYPWVPVFVGVVLTVVSAVLTNQIIGENIKLISEKSAKIDGIEQLISDNWQNSLALEAKKDTFTLVAQIADMKNPVVEDYISQLLKQSGAPEADVPKDITEAYFFVVEIVKQKRAVILENINDRYIEKLELQGQINELDNKNSTLQSMALFLYVLGLILVLSRDLRRGR